MGLSRQEFAAQVKEALKHLYDVAYLPKLPIASILVSEDGLALDERARAVRRLIVEAIDRLNPGPNVPHSSRERRSYAILSARYARTMTSQAVMEELALSERQYWRERSRAVDSLVDILWERYQPQIGTHLNGQDALSPQESAAQEEADLMIQSGKPEEVNGAEAVRGILHALQAVAESKQIKLVHNIADPPPLVFVDRAALRQIALNLLSRAFAITADRTVCLQLVEKSGTVQLIIETSVDAGASAAGGATLGVKIARRLVEAQGGHLKVEQNDERWTVTTELRKAERKRILVVDDNAAIISLFRRYLATSRYAVVPAESGQQVRELLQDFVPAAITLDLMMPSRDGLETLQWLRAQPETTDTPIIVCSVLDEPDLAFSLGANDYLRKPVSQSALLQALDRSLGPLGGEAPRHRVETEGI